MIELVTLAPQHAKALEQLQIDCFPTLAAHELMREEHFLSHARLFPEGSFVALDGNKVVGLGSGFFIDFDFDDASHTFKDIIAAGYYTNHDPVGAWYYGADISVHPHYRGRGVGKLLYEARKSLVRRNNRRGIVAGGVLPGYAEYKGKLTVAEYVDKVVAGELFDSTLSFQLKNGFEVRGLLENYLEDAASDNWATLIVWENPDYAA
ncbi:GNAT family N-acetyltransferase [soil metagenome]